LLEKEISVLFVDSFYLLLESLFLFFVVLSIDVPDLGLVIEVESFDFLSLLFLLNL
jgi:hypothetical protein